MAEVCLTTVDNPYSPFSEWENWYEFDVSKGYNTCQLLARIANSSDELSDAEEERIIEEDSLLVDIANELAQVVYAQIFDIDAVN